MSLPLLLGFKQLLFGSLSLHLQHLYLRFKFSHPLMVTPQQETSKQAQYGTQYAYYYFHMSINCFQL